MDSTVISVPKKLAAFLLAILALLASMTILAGCSSNDSSSAQSTTKEKRVLKVGVQNNALSIPTVYAYENGYFDELGIHVELSTFVNGAEENKALEKGEVDIGSNGLASVYMLATGNFSWIGESDDGSSTVAVYAKADSAPTQHQGELSNNPNVYGSTDSLRNLIVVGPAATMEEWVAVSYFTQFGLVAGEDYEFIPMDRTSSVDSMINGTADIFVATDADYSRLMEENGFVALAKGAEASGTQFNNGYIVNNKMLENHRELVVAFLAAVYKASEVLTSDIDLWNDFAYSYYQQNGKPATIEDVRVESQVRAPLVPSNFEAEDYRLGSGVLSVGRFLARIGAIPEDQVVNIEQSINTEILEEAIGVEVDSAILPKTS